MIKRFIIHGSINYSIICPDFSSGNDMNLFDDGLLNVFFINQL
jgi:hypothetical protein